MSFSSDVKAELCKTDPQTRHCAIAEIAAMVNTCGGASPDAGVFVRTENAVVAKKFFLLLKGNFKIHGRVSIRNHKKFGKSRVYSVSVDDRAETAKLLHALGLEQGRGVSPLIVQSQCCKRAYIRGAFISGGSLSDPDKTYHMEFVNTDEELLQRLVDQIAAFGIHARIISRKGHYVAYLKEGENIVDLLNIMGAHKSLMSFENTRIMKGTRNSVNRIVNCETANLTKTVAASVKQIEDIEYISNTLGLSWLSGQLEETARVRLANREASLKEIGDLLSPPVGKSGVNHRLRKISEIAENLKGGTL